MNPSEVRTVIGTLIGISFWGLSGTAAQALFQLYNFPVLALLTIRLVGSGAILLIVFRPRLPFSGEIMSLILVAIFGILGSQATYLAAIQYSNAATATLIQYLFLPMVAGYEAITDSVRMSARLFLVITLAVVGTILLIGIVGSVHLLLSPLALVFGLLAAITAAYYTLGSRPIVRKNGPWWLLTWGFLLSGAISLPLGVFTLESYTISPGLETELAILALVLFVTVFGTTLSNGLFLSGLKKLSATEAGVLSSFEPITAAIAAYALLGVVLTPLQYLGGSLILSAVVLIALGSRLTKQEKVRRI
jgi:drug/metabolite transporter (DMT)-like permease